MLSRLNLLLLLGLRGSQVSRMWQMDHPEGSLRKPCPCLVSTNAVSSNIVLGWCIAFLPTSWSIKWGDSRDQLECIDPRLAARMVNQLKSLRMRKNFQQQILSAPSSVTETTPDLLLEQVQEKDWRHPSFQYMSVFAIPFFELTCFSDLQDFEVSAHVRSSRFYFWMSEGLLDWSAFYLHTASACVGVYCKGEFV